MIASSCVAFLRSIPFTCAETGRYGEELGEVSGGGERGRKEEGEKERREKQPLPLPLPLTLGYKEAVVPLKSGLQPTAFHLYMLLPLHKLHG